MARYVKNSAAFGLRVIVGLALLGCPRVGSAQGTWSVISLPQQPGEVLSLWALAVDAAGNLYVADYAGSGRYRIRRRDVQGNWSVIAPPAQPSARSSCRKRRASRWMERATST
jgi:hypothetical protein